MTSTILKKDTHMKVISRSCGVGGVLVALVAVFGTGVATADDYAGSTYSDAKSKASASGRTPVVASVLGGRLAMDDCIVTRSQAGKWPNMMLSLSCNALQASASTPGGSVMDAQSQEFKKEKEAKDLEWKQSPDGIAWCKKAEVDHPEWVPIAGCDD